MKFRKLWIALAFSLLASLISCGDDGVTNVHTPIVTTAPTILPEAPGLVGTFSGEVQNKAHTKRGTLTISITNYDRYSGLLTGTLTLTGFSKCFTKGVFPHSSNHYLDNHYSPQKGFGSIIAIGNQPGSYSFLYFNQSDDFHKGLELNGLTEELAFFNGKEWCVKIEPVVLKRN